MAEQGYFFPDDDIPMPIGLELEEAVKLFAIPERLKRVPEHNSLVWVNDLKNYERCCLCQFDIESSNHKSEPVKRRYKEENQEVTKTKSRTRFQFIWTYTAW